MCLDTATYILSSRKRVFKDDRKFLLFVKVCISEAIMTLLESPVGSQGELVSPKKKMTSIKIT